MDKKREELNLRRQVGARFLGNGPEGAKRTTAPSVDCLKSLCQGRATFLGSGPH